MKRVLILGGGFGGLMLGRALAGAAKRGEVDVHIVNRDNYSLFTPMLPEVTAAGIAARHIVVPIRAGVPRATFHLGEVHAIDLDARSVEVVHPLNGTRQDLGYDHLVIALGGVTSTFGVPGVAEHSIPLKTLEDAETMRNRIVAMLELADNESCALERRRLLTFVVIGGGFTGVEAAGETADLLRNVSHFYPTISPADVRIVVVEGGPRLLPELPETMGVYSAKHLRRRGVEVLLSDPVASVAHQQVTLRGGATIEAATIIWSAGVRPSPLVEKLPLAHGKRGTILTNADFSVPDRPGVWALGDCASTPDSAGGFFPPTAQHAIREGAALAKNICAAIAGRPTTPFRYTSLGMMASLGGRRGAAQLPGNLVLTGFLAWFLWRTYYLSRLPGLDRKIRVAFDWSMGLFFARDIAELRVYSERSQRDARSDAGMLAVQPATDPVVSKE